MSTTREVAERIVATLLYGPNTDYNGDRNAAVTEAIDKALQAERERAARIAERAVTRQETLRLMDDGWILVDAGSWFWLMNENQRPLRVNNNSAKSIIRSSAHPLRRRLLQMWTIGETEVRP